MALIGIFQDEVRAALKAHDAFRLGVLRFALAIIKNREIEKRAKSNEGLTEEEVIDVLQKEVKRRKESVMLYAQGGRTDLVVKEEAELAVLAAYLPAMLDRDAVIKTIDELYHAGHTEFTSLMKKAMQRLKGKADGKLVTDVIKQKLGANVARKE